MALHKALLLLLCCSAMTVICEQMHCGIGVPLCGTLTLQTGFGSGVYKSKVAKVHGLWPEVGRYGTSECIKPRDDANPTEVYSCYGMDSNALQFETHEWTKHGRCSGANNAADFFEQVCSLSKDPVKVLERAEESGKDFLSMVAALKAHHFPVWKLDERNGQVLLSACAGKDKRWVLAHVSEMQGMCGGSSTVMVSRMISHASPSSLHAGSCVPGKRGLACSSDDGCVGVDGCVRCAHSGYCTDQPLSHGSSKRFLSFHV